MATTWNPSDLTNITLSNGNLTAQFTATASGGIRSIANASTGKWYWEITATNWTGAPSAGIGIANSLATTSNGVSTLTNGSAVLSSGDIWFNGAVAPGSPTLGARVNGDIIGIALDLDNKLIWYRVAPAGSWNGSGAANPATGAGGISIRAINPDSVFSPVYALFRGAPGGSASVVTANFGGSAFNGTVPAGFTSGFSTTAVNNIALSGNVREILLTTNPALNLFGITREILLATPTALTFAGLVREVLLWELLSTTISAARYSDPDSIYQATIEPLITNLVASRYIDPDSFYQADISKVIPSNLVYSYRVLQN